MTFNLKMQMAMQTKEEGFVLLSTILALILTAAIMVEIFRANHVQDTFDTSSNIVSDLATISENAKNIYFDGDYSLISNAQMISADAIPDEMIDQGSTSAIHSRVGGTVTISPTTISSVSYFMIKLDSIGKNYCTKIISNAEDGFDFIDVCPDKSSVGCTQVSGGGTAFDIKAVATQCSSRQLNRIIMYGK